MNLLSYMLLGIWLISLFDMNLMEEPLVREFNLWIDIQQKPQRMYVGKQE